MRIIAHLDLDAFFCAVEELHTPSLRGKPFAVGGSPEGRGVVASCSYSARMQGVHSAMPMAQALRLCPNLQIVSHNFGAYTKASRQVMEKIRTVSDLVEQISIDEAFFDLSDKADAERIAHDLQLDIYQTLHLPSSIGIAANKLVAKIANDFGKSQKRDGTPPRAFTLVPAGEEAAFLAPLSVTKLWGVGPKTAARLTEIGITTIGELAQQDELKMLQRFGQNGYEITRRARGIDNRPIVTERETKSISQETTFSKDISDKRELQQVLRKLSLKVCERLKKSGLVARTVAYSNPASGSDTVGDITNFTGIHSVPVGQGMSAQQIRVHGGYPVNGLGAYTGKVGHSHISGAGFIDNGHPAQTVSITWKFNPNLIQKAVVDFIDNFKMAGQKISEEVNLPFLHGLGQQGVVGVTECLFGDFPGLIPFVKMDIHQETH